MALHYLAIAEISARIRQGAISSAEVTEALLSRIDALDGDLGSYLCVTPDRAMEAAKDADAEMRRGMRRGPLHGVPIAVKDVIDTDFAPTTVGLAFRAGHVPGQSATVVRRLEMAGAVMLGKLATAEGIFVGHHKDYGTPRNPRDPSRWAGASSSGSGVATAAGLCFGSLGTDTGGSIRVPGSIHGLTGLKPTWGRVSRHGLFPLCPTLDHIGPMARSAEDAALLLAAIAGHDPADPTSLDAPAPDYAAMLEAPLAGLRIGVDDRYANEDVDAPVSAAFEEALGMLAQLGARIVPVAMPPLGHALAAWAPICASEAALAHDADYPSRAAHYGVELSTLLDLGRSLNARDLAAALAHRQEFCGRFAGTMADVDLIAMPTLPRVVPTVESIMTSLREGSTDLGRFTIPADMTGHPAVTLPMGIDPQGHPIGLQLVGHWLAEDLVLRAAHGFQRTTDWHTRRPEGL